MKQNKEIEARVSESSVQQVSKERELSEDVERFVLATDEMCAFIELNWCYSDVIEQIFCSHCKQNEEVEAVAACDIIEQLTKRNNCSPWVLACIVGNIAAACYARGKRNAMKGKL